MDGPIEVPLEFLKAVLESPKRLLPRVDPVPVHHVEVSILVDEADFPKREARGVCPRVGRERCYQRLALEGVQWGTKAPAIVTQGRSAERHWCGRRERIGRAEFGCPDREVRLRLVAGVKLCETGPRLDCGDCFRSKAFGICGFRVKDSSNVSFHASRLWPPKMREPIPRSHN